MKYIYNYTHTIGSYVYICIYARSFHSLSQYEQLRSRKFLPSCVDYCLIPKPRLTCPVTFATDNILDS